MVRGHLAYYAVPGNIRAVQYLPHPGQPGTGSMRSGAAANATACSGKRMNRLVARWLPPVRIVHPYPEVRFDVRTLGRSPVR